MKRVWIGCLLLALTATVAARDLDPLTRQARASMLVTGTIEVAPDGNVQGYSIDSKEKLPEAVLNLVDKVTHAWRFEPVTMDGKPVIAKATMSLRIVAEPVDKEHMMISLAGAQFGKESRVVGESVSYKDHPTPRYPQMAVSARVSGTVYVLLKIGRQGQVEDAVAQQVNLDWSGNVEDQNRWRRMLGEAALRTMRHWTFKTPTTGKHVDDAFWVARVPVVFGLSGFGAPRFDVYGQWHPYLPGPVQPIMWPDKDKLFTGAPDAMAGDGLFQLDQSMHLATPLNGV